jgi:membrane-associated phospholipid phosphatase
MSKQLPLTDAPAPRRLHYDWSWARLVSDVVSPPVVWAVTAVPLSIYADAGAGHAGLYAAIYIVLVCVLPIVYIALMVKRGKITDIHIKVRRQRIIPYMITILCAGLATLILWMISAPPLVTMFAVFSMMQIVIMLIVTTKWQISMHSLGITSAVFALGGMFGVGTAALFSPLIPIVGAARVVLKRHTVAQVIAGGCVGAVMTAILFSVVG